MMIMMAMTGDLTVMNAIKLETKRLYLREMTRDDFAALCRILKDPEVMYAYEHAFSDEEVWQWLERQLGRYEEYGHLFGLWAVVLKETGEMIGQCGITMQEYHGGQVPEIGYLLQRAYWHQGYATEAALACKAYGFGQLKMKELYSIIRDNNAASQRVAQRNGMVVKDQFVKHYYGIDMPHLVFSVTDDMALDTEELCAAGKTCFIVGAGSFDGMCIQPKAGDLVIAADGGYTYLKEAGIEADVLLGDFDSLERIPEHEHLERHSPIKDDTDMALAAAYGVQQGCRRFLIYGGLGGRLDHTIGNLQLLMGLSREGAEAYLIGEGNILTAATQECVTFAGSAQGILSVFCLSAPAHGVWERGLKYTLEDAVMTCDKTLGVSNEFIGEESSVAVGEGTLILLWSEENGLPKSRTPFFKNC